MKNYKFSNRMSNIKTIALDFDDVITPTLEEALNIYNKKYNKCIRTEDITSWDLNKEIVECFKEIDFSKIKCKFNSLIYIKELLLMTNVIIVTASCPETYLKKYYWILNNLPEFNINNFICCSNKEYIDADILVDDREYNLDKFTDSSPNKKGILFCMPHNKNNKKYIKIHTLKTLVEVMKFNGFK